MGFKRHLTYANVTATLALFIALGGSSYAALQLTGRDIRDNSLTGRDVRNNSLTGRDLREGRLGTVNRSRRANRLSGFPGSDQQSYSVVDLIAKCPPGTLPAANTCFEAPTARSPESFTGASRVCNESGKDFGPGRRLATLSELKSLVGDQRFQIAAAGELTSTAAPAGPDSLQVIFMAPNGTTSSVPDLAEGARPFRCVADPIN